MSLLRAADAFTEEMTRKALALLSLLGDLACKYTV